VQCKYKVGEYKLDIEFTVTKMKKAEMNTSWGTHGRDEKCIENFSWNILREVTIFDT
jgi:hypothetical protein